MAKCINLMALQDRRYRRSFSGAGLKSCRNDLGDGTVMQCWAPKACKVDRTNVVLIHGIGANAMWQWNQFLNPLCSKFNVFVPDLVFFGESFTTRVERTEAFQVQILARMDLLSLSVAISRHISNVGEKTALASLQMLLFLHNLFSTSMIQAQCVMWTMEAFGVQKMHVVGLSYGGYVGYSMAAQFPEAVDKVVIAASGVCMEEKDLLDGLFKVKSIEEATSILLPQSPEKLKELLRMTFYRPPRVLPSCIVNDFIDLMCTEYRQEKEELIRALHKDRKLSDLPKISQPTFIIWGEQDQVFPLELAHRLKRHLGDNAQLVIIKNAGHALNMEKPKRMFKLMKSFLFEENLPLKLESNGKNHKQD